MARDAVLDGRRNGEQDASGFGPLLRYIHEASRHRTPIHEGVMGNRGHCVRRLLIEVGDLIRGRAAACGVAAVDFVNRGKAYHRVARIHPMYIAWAGVVSRNENFTRSKRQPAHARSPEEHYQSGRIHWLGDKWSRRPAPVAVHPGPTPVVKGSKSPG